MVKLLLDAEPILGGAGIGINRKDRLGRSILHLASQFGLTNLTKELLKDKQSGGFGADPQVGDLINQRAIHYAIAFKNEETFEAHLDHLIKQE